MKNKPTSSKNNSKSIIAKFFDFFMHNPLIVVIIFIALLAIKPNFNFIPSSDVDILFPHIDRNIDEFIKHNQTLEEQFPDSTKQFDLLPTLWHELKTKGFVDMFASDSELRSSFIAMQAIIEESITDALLTKNITAAKMYIIAPRMPTPLMLLNDSRALTAEYLQQPVYLGNLRSRIIKKYLTAGGVLNAIYASEARDVYRNDIGFQVYNDYLNDYPRNLIDSQLLGVKLNDQDLRENTGAIYFLNHNAKAVIAIQSYQISQTNNDPNIKIEWSIKFGKHATDRLQKVNAYLDLVSGIRLHE